MVGDYKFIHALKFRLHNSWIILDNIGCPPTFVNMFKQLHRYMKARVTFNGRLSHEIAIDNGVIFQLPHSFSISFAVLLTHTFQDCEKRISYDLEQQQWFSI